MPEILDVWVFEEDGSTLISRVTDPVAVSALEELEGVGGGSLTVATTNPTLQAHSNLLDYRNVVKIRINNQFVSAFFVNKRDTAVVTDSGETVTVSGPGLLGWLEDAVVYNEFETPYGGTVRWFNWGAKQGSWYNAADWNLPAKVRKRGPKDWTDKKNPFAKYPRDWPHTGGKDGSGHYCWWIWDRESAWRTAPEGTVYFRKHIEVEPETKSHTLYITANNRFKVFLDGEPVMNVKERHCFKRTYEVDFDLGVGTHILAIKAHNYGSFAGLLVALFERDPNTEDTDEEGTLVAWSGRGWKCNPYPDEEPGWTAGEVLSTLLNEADDRNVAMVGYLSKTFTHTQDTDGVDWGTYTWSFDVGENYLSASEKMRDHAVHLSVDVDTLELNAYQTRGVNRSAYVFLAPGAHVADLSEEIEYALKNSLLVTRNDQWTNVHDSASIATYGRREDYVDLSQLGPKRVEKVMEALLAKAKIPTQGVTTEFIPGTGNRPWVDFWPGDFISVPTKGGGFTTRKVISISVTVDEAGSPRYTLEMDSARKDQVDRLQRTINNTGSSFGSVGGLSARSSNGGAIRAANNANPYGEPGGDYRTPGLAQQEESEEEWDVGDISATKANAMANTWDDYASITLALLTDEPTLTSGEWAAVDSVEITGTGYERIDVAMADFAAPTGNDPVTRSSTVDIEFPTNSGSSSWPDVTHVGVLDPDEAVLSIIPLSVSVTVYENQALVIPEGYLQLTVGSA